MRNQSGRNNPCYRHGMIHTRFYKIYYYILNRCNRKKDKCYYLYGGKGIKCLWSNFLEFKNDMYDNYLEHVKKFGEKNTSIDRIDNNKNYCKSNCKWSTSLEQGRNTSRNRIITIDKKSAPLSVWVKRFNIDYNVVSDRINKLGWDPEIALKTPKLCRN